MSETTPSERVSELIADYLELARNGQSPPRERWLQEHADVADELQRFLDNQEWLLRLGEPLPPGDPGGGGNAGARAEGFGSVGHGALLR